MVLIAVDESVEMEATPSITPAFACDHKYANNKAIRKRISNNSLTHDSPPTKVTPEMVLVAVMDWTLSAPEHNKGKQHKQEGKQGTKKKVKQTKSKANKASESDSSVSAHVCASGVTCDLQTVVAAQYTTAR